MNIASYIDHTLLKAEATPEQVAKLCSEAMQYRFASVCVNPSYVTLADNLLRGSGVAVCTVIGFPLGATSTDAKLYEAGIAVTEGARELDMVIHIGRLHSGNNAYVENEINRIANLAHANGAILKVIIETSLLSYDERILACQLAQRAGADFVKTSTGFSTGGATINDIETMRRVVGSLMGVKASGGISTYADAMDMINAGATRIGTSKGVAIVNGAPQKP